MAPRRSARATADATADADADVDVSAAKRAASTVARGEHARASPPPPTRATGAAAAAAAAAAAMNGGARVAREARAASAGGGSEEDEDEDEEEESGSDLDEALYDVGAAVMSGDVDHDAAASAAAGAAAGVAGAAGAAAAGGGAVDGDEGAAVDLASRGRRQLARGEVLTGAQCPYMDTIDRAVLDLDRARQCSVTSRTSNIYCCLVDGRYFQGRGVQSPAFFHALQNDAHLFLNLETKKVYCLPEGYEVQDRSLQDILFELDPDFGADIVSQMDTSPLRGRAVDGKEVVAGLKGLTALSSSARDSVFNAVLQMMAHVSPLRDALFLHRDRLPAQDSFVAAFGAMVRKLWNHRSFRANVNPHAFVHAAQLMQGHRFGPSQQMVDAAELVPWLLNELHQHLGGTRAADSSLIYRLFQGELELTTRKETRVALDDDSGDAALADGAPAVTTKVTTTVRNTPFLLLPLDIPPAPLFKDAFEENIIPQVQMDELLKRFDGSTVTFVRAEQRLHQFTRLPPYIFMLCKRFQKNAYFVEKNPTVVLFPLAQLDLGRYLKSGCGDGRSYSYRLVAVMVHDGPADGGVFRVNIFHKALGKWFEFNDTTVTERLPHAVQYSEAYLLLYERA